MGWVIKDNVFYGELPHPSELAESWATADKGYLDALMRGWVRRKVENTFPGYFESNPFPERIVDTA